MITVSDLEVRFGAAVVLTGAELTLRPGRVTGLIGPNGSGKSSLLRAIIGAVRSTGALTVDESDLRALSVAERARRIAVVAQDDQPAMAYTVTEIVQLGRSMWGRPWSRSSDRDAELVARAMEQTGVAHLADRSILELSGGERQRVLIARAIVQQSSYLLLDEPTNHLDVHYQHEILGLVRSLGATSLVVLHDLNLAARYCDDLILLEAGHVVATGTVADLMCAEVLEPVYQVTVRRIEDGGVPQLILGPPERRVRARPGRASGGPTASRSDH